MANFLDDDLTTLLCDHCGDETQVKVRNLRQNLTVTCLACGVSLDYNAAEFKQAGERREQGISDFRDSRGESAPERSASVAKCCCHSDVWD